MDVDGSTVVLTPHGACSSRGRGGKRHLCLFPWQVPPAPGSLVGMGTRSDAAGGDGEALLVLKMPGKLHNGDNPAVSLSWALCGAGTPWPRVSGTYGPMGPKALATTAGVGPSTAGWERDAGPAALPCLQLLLLWMGQLPRRKPGGGSLEQRLFAFLSWLCAGQAIFKLFLFFLRVALLPEVLLSSLCKERERGNGEQRSCSPAPRGTTIEGGIPEDHVCDCRSLSQRWKHKLC